jgi:membrane-associated phospholipid phosphatase
VTGRGRSGHAAARAAARRAAPLYALATCGLLAAGMFLTRVVADGLVGVALVVVLVLVRRGRLADAAIVVVALAFELAVFLSTTFVVGRPRPDVVRLNRTPSTDSFPSGHTAATFALYGALALLATRPPAPPARRIVAWSAVVLLVALVGFARVYRGMHHVTDVLAGAALGAIALVSAVLVVDAARERARFAAPERSPAPARTIEADGALVPERVTTQERGR